MMNHLTAEELIEFVSFTELNEETAKLASRVNSHIIKCDQCHKNLMAFQDIYDELSSICEREAIKSIIMAKYAEKTAEAELFAEHEGR